MAKQKPQNEKKVTLSNISVTEAVRSRLNLLAAAKGISASQLRVNILTDYATSAKATKELEAAIN